MGSARVGVVIALKFEQHEGCGIRRPRNAFSVVGGARVGVDIHRPLVIYAGTAGRSVGITHDFAFGCTHQPRKALERLADAFPRLVYAGRFRFEQDCCIADQWCVDGPNLLCVFRCGERTIDDSGGYKLG